MENYVQKFPFSPPKNLSTHLSSISPITSKHLSSKSQVATTPAKTPDNLFLHWWVSAIAALTAKSTNKNSFIHFWLAPFSDWILETSSSSLTLRRCAKSINNKKVSYHNVFETGRPTHRNLYLPGILFNTTRVIMKVNENESRHSRGSTAG